MGITRFVRVAKEMVRATSGVTDTRVGAPPRPEVCAIDANSLIYWAYQEYVDTLEEVATRRTTADSPKDVIRVVVGLFMECLAGIARALDPETLIITLDGVPPLSKILDQRRRRIEAPPTDIYDRNDQLLFTTSWLCPGAPLLVALDAALALAPVSARKKTIYSGPGIDGEGEHKIFTILNSIRPPKSVVLIGNDNDLYLLSALYVASHDSAPPRVLLYNDKESSRGPGILRPAGPENIITSEIGLFVEATKSGPYAAPGRTALEKVSHFAHLTSLLGNDFLPAIYLGPELDKGALLKAIMSAARNEEPYIRVPPPKISDTPQYVAPTVDRKQFAKVAASIDRSVTLHIDSITKNTWSPAHQYENARALCEANGLEYTSPTANAAAFVAASDYVAMLEWVLGYYLTSTTSRSRTPHPMPGPPEMYYGWMRPPPSFSYLAAGAQLVAAHHSGDAHQYKKISEAAERYQMGVAHPHQLTPAPYCERGFQAALIYPGRTGEGGEDLTNSRARVLAAVAPRLYPTKDDGLTNTALIPRALMSILRHGYSLETESAPPDAPGLRSTILVTEAHDGLDDGAATDDYYVQDSLNV